MLAIMLIPILLSVAPVTLIVAIVKSNKIKEKKESSIVFESIIRASYTYIILIILFVMIIYTGYMSFSALINIALPEKQEETNYYYDSHDNNGSNYPVAPSYYYDDYNDYDSYNDNYNEERYAIMREKNKNTVSLISHLSTFVISLTLFIFYNSIAKKDFKNKKANKIINDNKKDKDNKDKT